VGAWGLPQYDPGMAELAATTGSRRSVPALLSALRQPVGLGRAKQRLASRYVIDLGRGFDSLVFVAGTGRSGTTWLADLVNADNSGRMIFEPFAPEVGAFGSRVPPQYIRPEENDPTLVEDVRAVLLGKAAPTRWTGKSNNRLIARRRIIKDVQSNLRLAWLRGQFPPFPIILILRHPCAVAGSRRRLGDDLKASFSRLLAEPHLVEDHLAPLSDELLALETPFERAVAKWCIETLVPLRQFATRPFPITCVFYEHLVTQPEAVLDQIFAALGRNLPTEVWRRLETPSQTAYRGGEPLERTGLAVDEWQHSLTRMEIDRAIEVVQLFGLGGLYGRDAHPLLAVGEPVFESFSPLAPCSG
jgi:hypothetical protein